MLEVVPWGVSQREEQGEMWSSRYVAGGGCRGSGEVWCAVQRGGWAAMLVLWFASRDQAAA